jgi:H/ACA ribonucleoprotein complex subunit 4
MGKFPFEEVRRDVIVKKECSTNPLLGCEPSDRPSSEIIEYGIVNIDKPKGPTSHQVSDFVKTILGISKAGHSGSLDPGVTGLLSVALGRATRVVHSLLLAGKEYVCVMHIHKPVEEALLRKTINEFVGRIKQLPPKKSAVKRQWRERTVYYFEVMEIDGQDVLFRVGTEAGTYIRKLVFDLGLKLGVGANMAELRRTRVGPFDESTKVTLQELIDAFWYYKNEGNDKLIRKVILPVESAIQHLGKIWVNDNAVDALCHGITLKIPGICKLEAGINSEDIVAVMTLKNELVATGTAKMDSSQMMNEQKGIAVKIDKVFMKDGVYKIIK